MNIIRAVAIHTVALHRIEFMAGVAALAGRYCMHAFQWKLRELMIEVMGFIPACTLVTYTAVTQFFRFMDVVGAMAVITLGAQAVIQ